MLPCNKRCIAFAICLADIRAHPHKFYPRVRQCSKLLKYLDIEKHNVTISTISCQRNADMFIKKTLILKRLFNLPEHMIHPIGERCQFCGEYVLDRCHLYRGEHVCEKCWENEAWL